MKTILVLSDTHGNKRAINSLREVMAETDYIVHLGDYSRDMAEIKERWREKTICVDGNCDAGFHCEEFFEAEGKKILAVHGHRYGVKGGIERLERYARETGADIALFGHTHKAYAENRGGIWYVNPGALAARAKEMSYAYIVIGGGQIACRIERVKQNF